MSVYIEKLPGIAFLAFPEMLKFLKSELRERFSISDENKFTCYGDVLYLKDCDFSEFISDRGTAQQKGLPYWAKTALFNPFVLHFDSIGDAAKSLKEIQRNWAPYQYQHFRRASLIQDKLPYINLKPKNFPVVIPKSPVGIYTLTDEKTIFASDQTSSFLPAGNITFVEDHENPPSRAYLKIQESLTMANLLFDVPLPDENCRCFEAGACPGGWTWVLVNLGASVFAVDRTELAESLMQNDKVTFLSHDAFTLKPEEVGKCDWVFSDVICYPNRLLEWVKKWLSSGLTKKMICTIKMQGETDWEIVREFEDIPDSRVLHLNYNKHELTWIHIEK
ncbi:MAG: SAM-dependent methyltransferase [Treponema sp.]